MLKISEYRNVLGEDRKSIRREKIDLKELEKFGFVKDPYNVIYQYQESKFTGIRVEIATRRIGFYNSIDIVVEGKVTDVLYDLIKADLVEKVEM